MKIARLFFVLLFCLPHFLFAGNTGKISGKVTDAKNSEGLMGANIHVVGTSFGAVTDFEGNYSIIGVPPGTHTLKASLIGYNSVTVTNVGVNIDLTTKQDFVLTETTVEVKEMVIVAEKPMVQHDITASTSIVSKELISNLAVTEMRDVIQLQAGIVSQGGELHLRGGRKGQIAYQIDGVPVSDAYDGSNTIDLGANAIQELQVVSGAFNAEYGQAMSGIVNIVTKDGGDRIAGNVQMFSGSYLTERDNIFWNLKNYRPLSVKNVDVSLSGPIISDKLYFYLNGRYYGNEGFHWGKRVFTLSDFSFEDASSSELNFIIRKTGNDEYVSLNPNTKNFFQSKLAYRLFSNLKVSYNYIYDYQNYRDFDNGVRFTPDNNLERFRFTHSNIVTINHALSASSFYNVSLSYLYKDYKHELFFPYFYSFVPTLYVDHRNNQNPPYTLGIGGTKHDRFHRNTGTTGVKLDWMNQFTKEIAVQFGGDLKKHRLFYQNINLVPKLDSAGLEVFPYDVMVAPISSQSYDEYLHEPTEASMYFQTKIEAFNLILNAGFRLDYFNPDGNVLNDAHSNPSDPLYYQYTVDDPNINSPLKPDNRFFDYNGDGVQDTAAGERTKTVADRMLYWYKKAEAKTQISPRFGLAFPISADGVIHFSFGHFFQLPSYELMYANPEFEIGTGSGIQGLFGNADLEPQKTVKGEIGLKQQLSEEIAADVTMFFEDFRNLVGTQTADVVVFGRDRSYRKYVNTDFGFSKGIVVKIEKRFSDGVAANLDYTYSITKYNASDPADSRNAVFGGKQPETYLAPADWDQTHTLNVIVAYTQPQNWGLSVITNFSTGNPYSPTNNKNSAVKENVYPYNSEYKPNVFNVDLRLNKDFHFGSSTLSLFLRVFNLLDLDNARNVNANSGDPFFNFDRLEAEENIKTYNFKYYNTLDDYYTNPSYFSEPRRIELGTSFTF